MLTDRRGLLAGAATLTAAALAAAATPARAARKAEPVPADSEYAELDPASSADQTTALQAAIERAAATGKVLRLPVGIFLTRTLGLPGGTHISGVEGATKLRFIGEDAFIVSVHADGIVLEGLVIDGASRPLDTEATNGLITFNDCSDLTLRNVTVTGSLVNGLSLRRCSGRITGCTIRDCIATGLFSEDSGGLAITGNSLSDIGNNGIQIWRSEPGEDGSIVALNRISRVSAKAGGTGENGNGINIFRAGSVSVSNNTIADCAFSAVRANAASNCTMTNNTALRSGEVALYAEFGFEGVVISGNLVDGASSGVSVTNFKEGGRLAVVSSNLIRNLSGSSPNGDNLGTGISVEADCSVSGNVVENAARYGILVGWGEFRRDVAVTGNVVRGSPIAIGVSSDAKGGAVLIAQNLISGASQGAVKPMDHEKPLDGDLARNPANAGQGITVTGNAVA